MNDLELTIRLTDEYDACFQNARTLTNLHKCRCWFDRKNVSNNQVTVTLTSYSIILRYCTSKEQIEETCTYDTVLSVTETYNGIMLRLSHKRLLFLQAADNRKDTELLMQAMVMLGEHCKYLFRKSSLYIGKAGLFEQIKFRLRPKQGYYDGAGYWNALWIALICITAFIATVFVLEPVNNRIITESEAIRVQAIYSSCDPAYRRGHGRYIDLEFTDHKELTVDSSCFSSNLVHQLDNIPAGTQFHMLVHPKSESVLQIDIDGELLLEFNDAQNRIWKESVIFAIMGLFLYIGDLGLLIGLIRKKM